MNRREIRLITKSNTTVNASNEVIITSTTAATKNAMPKPAKNISISSADYKKLMTGAEEITETEPRRKLNEPPMVSNPLNAQRIVQLKPMTPAVVPITITSAASKTQPSVSARPSEVSKAADMTIEYEKFLNKYKAGTSSSGTGSGASAQKTETCVAQISANLEKILAGNADVKRRTGLGDVSPSKAPPLQVRVTKQATSLLRAPSKPVTATITAASTTSVAPPPPAPTKDYSRETVRKHSESRLATEAGIKRPQTQPESDDDAKRPKLERKPSVVEVLHRAQLSKSLPYATAVPSKSDNDKSTADGKCMQTIKLNPTIFKVSPFALAPNQTPKPNFVDQFLKFSGHASYSSDSGSNKVLNKSLGASSSSVAVPVLMKPARTMTAKDIKETLLQAFNGNASKSDQRSSTDKQPRASQQRTAVRSKSVHAVAFGKTHTEDLSAIKQPKITQESFDSEWESLTEVLSSKTSKSQRPRERIDAPKVYGGMKKPPPVPTKLPAVASTSSGSSSCKPAVTSAAMKGVVRAKPTLIAAEAPAKQKKTLALPFMSALNNSIEWNRPHRVGTLPNAVLAFERNEFGMLELHQLSTNISSSKDTPKMKKNKRAEPLSSVQCDHSKIDVCFNTVLLRWGDDFWMNQTTPVEYHSEEFKEVIRSCIRKHHGKCNLVSISDIRETMASSKHFKQTAQWRFTKFEWDAYLSYWNASHAVKLSVAPIKIFFNPAPSTPNPFLVGQKLEAIDPQNCSLFCVCTVVDVRGYRIKLHFDGHHTAYDFWTNADSTGIFPIGWCGQTARMLEPPPGYAQNFKWAEYLSRTNSIAAPRSYFTHLTTSNTSRNPFKIGMKLEADDIKNSRKICVATIGDVIDNRVLVTFDGLDRQSNFWADVDSPYLHPVNWHAKDGFSVQAPPGWKHHFVWEEYLRTKRAEAAPADAFYCTRNPINFEKNMVLEVVDACNPSIIRPARITMVDEYEIKVLFLEWPERFEFWLKDDCPDIHPTGWCRRTGHPLTGPKYGEENGELRTVCGTPRCNGIGNVGHPGIFTHDTAADCPYSPENWSNDKRIGLPNRLSPACLKRARVPETAAATREPQAEPSPLIRKEGVPPKTNTTPLLRVLLDPPELQTMKPNEAQLYRRLQVATRHLLSNSANLSILHDKWLEKLQPLKPVQVLADRKNPLNWTIREVADFVSKLPNCLPLGRVFVDHEIDGLAFLSLRQSDMTNRMGLSLGAAIKVFNRIVLLREECNVKYIKYN